MDLTPQDSDTVILVTNNGMGTSDTDLQHKLISTYLQLLNENNYLPALICFYTEGVKLTVEGSPVLTELKALEDKGVRLVICGTCLNYFGIQDQVKVGLPGGMTDIIEAQWRAKKVITL